MTDSDGTAAAEDDEAIPLREIVAVVLLSLTAIATAWCGFEASKWGGSMSISFSQASSARIEAARLDGAANRKQTVQVSLFAQWLEAYQDGDEQLTDFLSARFPEPLATAFPLWLAERPLQNPDAPDTPFDMPVYAIPELAEAQAADDRADATFAKALRDNQRGDNYAVLTVGFATVLFFGALSGRMRRRRLQVLLLGLAWAGFVVLAILLATFPKLV
jgi:hypothetical protein